MWMGRARFCPVCAGELVSSPVHGRVRKACPACGVVLYENPASAAAAVVLDDAQRVLLVRRGIEPFLGAWALPAGYQEIDEHPHETVVREVREETGLDIAVDELFDLLHVPDDPRKPANLAIYLCRVVSGELRAGDDALEAAWFALDALPAEIGFHNREVVLQPLARRLGR
ncbi:MAG: NUDIX hydrolase [Planctomycetes bacterium]|nr:NUDIX hydrolase [Planctomycetota bacterium]